MRKRSMFHRSIFRADPNGDPDINTTPLINVMLVMLVMFIITIPPPTHSVDVTLPCGGDRAGQDTRRKPRHDRYERCNPLERRSHRSRRVRRPGKAGVGACETGGDPARTRRAGALSARRRGDRRDPAQWRHEARLSWHPELRSEEHTSEIQSL